MTRRDVVIVGAGPAGSAAALRLAASGIDVLCLERARFPRSKPCAEYLSPQATYLLSQLGVLGEIERAGPARLRGMQVTSPDGSTFLGRFARRRHPTAPEAYGLALPRERFDTILADAARRRGAELRDAVCVESLDREPDGTIRVRTRTGAGRETIRARFLVGADGLHSRVARWLGRTGRGGRRRIALVTHVRPVAEMRDVGEMVVARGAYIGLAPVGDDVTNVALVAESRCVPRGRTPEVMFDTLLQRFPAVMRRLAGGSRVSPVRAAGPFARWSARATGDGALLVGDAADFYDPFTGEGIHAALRGAELAAARVAVALATGRRAARDLAGYDRDRWRAFGTKWILERAIAAAVATPAAFDHVARRLRARPSLADLLVSVTGNLVPASRVLRPGFLRRLVW